ncbi:MAG: squalene--hopene cyclase [Phycisphaeraceae bacterium]
MVRDGGLGASNRATGVVNADASADDAPLAGRAQAVLPRAVAWLFDRQHADGHWCAELEGDSILQSEYILLKWILGHEDDERLPKIAAYLRRQQQADGTWAQYPTPGGPSRMDLSATVKGYFALKLHGDDPEAEHMRKARAAILAGGGAERVNSFTKFYLACLGQIDWSAQPSIPPEVVFLPKWFYFHLDKLSAWTRTMILPLAIVTTYRPTRRLESDKSIDELYVEARYRRKLIATQDRPHPFWSRFFLVADRGLKGVHALGLTPWRKRAVKWIEDWLHRHLVKSDGLGAIFPPMVYIQIAFRCLGYPDDHPMLVKARKDLDELMIHDAETDEIRIQPCFSPVWDTGIASFALTEAGLDHEHEGLARAAEWLLSKECRFKGDWAANVTQNVEPAGWFFEYNNAFYPDVDDTAMVSMALKRIGGDAAKAAAARGVAWNFVMQNDDGGWAAFDRGAQNRPILDQVPFADHNAMQDPSCPDITGRVFESLGWHGYTVREPAVQRGIEHIRAHQQPDGCWFGRWGVNYIYGTFEVLCGLHTVHADMSQDWIQKAGQWLRDHQNANGSFGESPDTYEDPSLRGQGPPTASQTAWGVMGLMAVYGHEDEAVQRGIRWLCDTQIDEGTWDEPWFTGTGFPRVFYLRYHYYRHYFPIMAIGRWLRLSRALPAVDAAAATEV